MSRCTCDAIRATGWCPAHPPKPHVDLRDAELASLRAEVERLKGDHAQVAGALGCVHEQSMGECHAGTGDDVLCAIATLRGEIVILHSANARGASMVNEINAARAAFARRLGDALGISEDDSIIAAIATLRADLARVTEERDEAMAALEGVGDALGGLELYALSETAGHVETVVADRDEALADLARVEAERDEARAEVAAARCETCVRLDRLAPCVECPQRDASPLGRLISRMDDAGMTATGAVAECPACDGMGDVDYGFEKVECCICDGTGYAKGGE